MHKKKICTVHSLKTIIYYSKNYLRSILWSNQSQLAVEWQHYNAVLKWALMLLMTVHW